MYYDFQPLRRLLRIDKVSVDNYVFKMHYKATTALLLGFSIVITACQYFGDAIDCIVEEIPSSVMDKYCWINPTFTVPKWEIHGNVFGSGIGSYREGKDEVKYHKYYQWVSFALFFQALLFYCPHYFWKAYEGKKLNTLVSDMNFPVVNEEDRSDHIELIVGYFIKYLNYKTYYFSQFALCEMMNLINVIGQIIFMDVFLDGQFSTYGTDVLKFMNMEEEHRFDPMSKVFPTVTKCTFLQHGASGTIEKFDGICILYLNVINEKIYIFLWFWFVFLALITLLSQLCNVIILISSRFRVRLLYFPSDPSLGESLKYIVKTFNTDNWFLLYQISKNVDEIVFSELVTVLATTLREEEGLVK